VYLVNSVTVASRHGNLSVDVMLMLCPEVWVNGCRRGEEVLRASGLGYTVVRPGPLLEEPGGYKALVFDQGNRIAQTITCADAADVALKVIH
jgi:hypothetical protein